MSVPRVSTEQALASVVNLRTDPGGAADRDELRYRIRTAVKYAEALLCDCRWEEFDQRHGFERVWVVCDRCQILGILTPGTTP